MFEADEHHYAEMEQAIEAANISMSAGWGVMATSSECDGADISINSHLKSLGRSGKLEDVRRC